LKDFLDNKSTSESAVSSYVIVKLLCIASTLTSR